MEEKEKNEITSYEEKDLNKFGNLSVTSFVLSLLGIVAFPTIVGLLILGILSLIKARQVPDNYDKAPYRALRNIGKGLGLFEVILAGVAVAVGVIVFFVYMIILIAAASAASAGY